MFKPLLLAGLAVAAITPSVAAAQCASANANRAAGTVVGAGVGALLGSAISGGRAGGAIVGGVGGAVAGNAIAGANSTCANQYGYYDANGVWIPNTATAWGYYGPDGRWVDRGPPPGPAAYAPGPQSDVDVAYTGHDPWAGAPMDTRGREDWLRARIRAAMDTDILETYQGTTMLHLLDDVRRTDFAYRSGTGQLNPPQRQEIMARLDELNARLWNTVREERPGPH
jgi:hypothetical protein